ncbi:AraC family transcriptional regulator [Qipengyuania sp. GH25]|uniref:AraC family transcriptional regulator n=1 Tax=Qipengyuania pacifica TaxID=2860199 RepID=A0ABS7JK85_9SPHN|nr:AraC family transcriptional regulator [Qipengyuania aerophila]
MDFGVQFVQKIGVIVQKPSNDPLSDVASLVQLRGRSSVRLEIGNEWAMRFVPEASKLNVIQQGECWVEIEGMSEKMSVGDCLFVKAGVPFVLASDLVIDPVNASEFFAEPENARLNSNISDVVILGGSFEFEADHGDVLTEILPDYLVIKKNHAESSILAGLLAQLDNEWRAARAGSRAICDDLIRLIFFHALRIHFERSPHLAPGWFAAIVEPGLGAAMAAIHSDPSHHWTVSELARIAGKSRSAFAERFVAVVGVGPVTYASDWRLRLAAVMLTRSKKSVTFVARAFGYLSDSAFGTAFRRKFGVSPGRYSRQSTNRVATRR